MPATGGASVGAHYRQLEKTTGVRYEEGEIAEELPDELAYLWTFFSELHNARSSNGYSPNPIAYSEIAAWSTLTDRRLAVWEVLCLRRLDDLWMKAWNHARPGRSTNSRKT